MTTATLIEEGRKGGSAPKHKWTDEERAIVRREYNGHNQSAYLIAAKLTSMTGDKITFCAVKEQAARMGILQNKNPDWTDKEIEILSEMITQYAPITIAHRLHRSLNAIVVKSKRLGYSRRVRDGWYTKAEVAEILGVDHKKVQNWINSGAIKAGFHNPNSPPSKGNGSASWHIKRGALIRFIRKYPQELVGRNVDIIQIVDLLAGLDVV